MKSRNRMLAIFLALTALLLPSCQKAGAPAESQEKNPPAETVEKEEKPAVPTETEEESTATAEEPAEKPADPAGAASEPTTTTTAGHSHSFSGATCNAGGKCKCGAVGTPLGHDYRGGSCTSPAACSRCGAAGSPLGHAFGAQTCTSPAACARCGATQGGALGHSYSKGRCTRCGDTGGPLSPGEAALFHNRLSDEENAQALAVARSLASQISAAGGSDFDRVSLAAQLVSREYAKGTHVEKGDYYHTAYGVFVKRESSCAGCTRALGLVLSLLGYSWSHVNENQWAHQWVTLNIGGEAVWADGQIGWAGYGAHPAA